MIHVKMVYVGDRSYFKFQGVGRLKSRGGGSCEFQCVWLVRGEGVAINFDFPAGGGGGGSCLNCSNKIIIFFLARFACSCFIN